MPTLIKTKVLSVVFVFCPSHCVEVRHVQPVEFMLTSFHLEKNEQRTHKKVNIIPSLTSTLTILALLTVALWRGRVVARRLVVVTSSVLGWLLVAPAAPIATSLTSTAAITTSTLSTTRGLVVARSLRVTFIPVEGGEKRSVKKN